MWDIRGRTLLRCHGRVIEAAGSAELALARFEVVCTLQLTRPDGVGRRLKLQRLLDGLGRVVEPVGVWARQRRAVSEPAKARVGGIGRSGFTYLHDILYLQVPVLRKKVHCCSPGRRGYDCCCDGPRR